MNRIFIGYDSREVVAYHVLVNSIMRHAREPVSITPLILGQLPMVRERDALQSTEFAFSRFLVPWLCGYRGRALFMDCDMLVRSDIGELFDYNHPEIVSVVKHDYEPCSEIKFFGQRQSRYLKKNWSSVMLFNNDMCRGLTPHVVNTASGLYLHQFQWAESVGELGAEWNHLVGEYVRNPFAKIAHFTLGTPFISGYEGCEFADEWFAEHDLFLTKESL